MGKLRSGAKSEDIVMRVPVGTQILDEDKETVLFDLTKPGQPRVVASSGNHLLHYRLTVYDNSPIQKVANKDIEIPLLTDLNAWDLMMRDAYADMGKERNNMDSVNANDWNIWESPDVWNRVLADGGLEHEDPVHSQYAPNHLYVRVKNIGCAPSPAQGDSIWLNLYWTIASTGETWPIDWVGGSAINGHPAGQHIGMVPVSSLQPGKDTILWHDWQPPLPQDYDSTVTDIEVCVLARIETSPVPDFGMAFPEVPVTKENVWNNNNIVTRNLVVYDFSSGQKIVNSTIGVGNSGPTPTVFTVQIATGQHLQPNLHGHPADFLTATLELGGLYDLWVAGGRQGNVSSYNDEAKSVTYDLERPIRLEHIELGPLERHMIHVKLTMKDNVVVPEHVNSDRLFIRQLIEHQEMVEGPNGPTEVKYDEVYGTVAFAIRISPTEGEARERRAQTQQQIEETQLFRLYPNPSDNQFMIESLLFRICWPVCGLSSPF